VKLAGEMVVPEQDLKSLIVIQPGDPFAQNLLTMTEKAMGLRLGLDGYAFSQVALCRSSTKKRRRPRSRSSSTRRAEPTCGTSTSTARTT
jgi:outer membrane protein insertion porin family